MPQEPLLFTGPVSENISGDDQEYSEADIIESAKLAEAHDFIMNLPNGYSTEVGERGSAVSGGQRQRIAIARTLLNKPNILILDEATSHLDAVNEAAVHDSLQNLMHGRTTLIIAHRLSTVRHATQIVVMEAGKVVEVGDHDSLLQTGCLYSRLLAHQLSTSTVT